MKSAEIALTIALKALAKDQAYEKMAKLIAFEGAKESLRGHNAVCSMPYYETERVCAILAKDYFVTGCGPNNDWREIVHIADPNGRLGETRAIIKVAL